VKTTNVYIIRHCESVANVKNLFYTFTDCDISSEGEIQLRLLKEYFRKISIEAIYTSPLLRTMRTAEAVGCDKGIKIICDKELMEIHGGKIEGMNEEERRKRFAQEFETWYADIGNFKAPNGESTREVYRRMKRAILRIVRENQGKTIAIVSHNCAIYMLMSFLHGYSENEISERQFWSYNTGINLVSFDGELKPTVKLLNSLTHLQSAHFDVYNKKVEIT